MGGTTHLWGYGRRVDNPQRARIWKSLGAVKLHLNHISGILEGLEIVEYDMMPTGTIHKADEMMADLRKRKDEREKREALARAKRRVVEEKAKLEELERKYGVKLT